MTTVSADEQDLVIEIEGVDKFLALKSHLRVPLTHIVRAEPAVQLAKEWYHGFRVGTSLPGIMTAGTFFKDGKKTFWDVHDPEKAIIIYLNHESYQQLVIEVENPEMVIGKINQAVKFISTAPTAL